MFPEDGVCLNKLNQHLNTLPGQTRCVDYFEMFDTDPDLWIAAAVM